MKNIKQLTLLIALALNSLPAISSAQQNDKTFTTFYARAYPNMWLIPTLILQGNREYATFISQAPIRENLRQLRKDMARQNAQARNAACLRQYNSQIKIAQARDLLPAERSKLHIANQAYSQAQGMYHNPFNTDHEKALAQENLRETENALEEARDRITDLESLITFETLYNQ